MIKKYLGLIGANSLVGNKLLNVLPQYDYSVIAFSRQPNNKESPDIEWRCFTDSASSQSTNIGIPLWICVAPIWVLPQYFKLLQSFEIKKIVVLSSTSQLTKKNSTISIELDTVSKLINGEEKLKQWVLENNIELTILRSTMIYGYGVDKNIAEISRFINKWGFFPILGKGNGKRQPIHVDDIVNVCISAIHKTTKNQIYTISGGEVLSYKEMVSRVFFALQKKPRIINFPRWLFIIVTKIISILPRYRNWSVAMADRMDQDLISENEDANNDYGVSPRTFSLNSDDLPK